MAEEYMEYLLLVVVLTFLVSAIIVPKMAIIAKHIGAIDVPKDNRRAHTKPIPRLGGLGIFIAFLIGYMCFGVHSVRMNSILIGGFIIVITGMIDDINPISAKAKLIGQVFAGLSVILYGNLLIDKLTVFGQTINFGIFSYPITLLFIVACVNVMNLIDGLDGLSGGITSIFMITAAIISYYQGRSDSLEILLALIMLGSTLGFLLHNFHPAKIFAGDTGSMFMGFIISIISILGYKGAFLTSVVVPISVLAIPFLDTLFAICRRLLKRQPIFSPDKEHLHHQFLKMNFSQRTTVLIIYFINILFSAATIFFVLGNKTISITIYLILLVLVIWFVLNTNILSSKLSDKVRAIEHKMFKKNK